ncbi:hypothetical protein CU669_03790 [Paramagnetospirillum kuznetsovii]|uniref:CopC domain-containing protein n=1 Tax=Paramagnetospirillum kuznetsovii TaxID=2053833 RepID=A0A364P1Q5_9PROT|nr:copper resistance CopC family protein [Paramagnetospirillum kuznetsovii]RAU23278.1 hypothetical protein CU669_03790 [Paramagnetospirillum kuznetsovii]
MIRTLLLCAILAVGLMTPDAAQAHAVLVESTPIVKSKVPGDKIEINLHYNSRIDAKRSRLVLKGAGGETVLTVRQGKTEADIAATAEGLKPGAYTLLWDVLSVDGHVSRGKIPFTAVER